MLSVIILFYTRYMATLSVVRSFGSVVVFTVRHCDISARVLRCRGCGFWPLFA